MGALYLLNSDYRKNYWLGIVLIIGKGEDKQHLSSLFIAKVYTNYIK
jgi:hypothetical protein